MRKLIWRFWKRVILIPSTNNHGAGGSSHAHYWKSILGKDCVVICGGDAMRVLAEKAKMSVEAYIKKAGKEIDILVNNHMVKLIKKAYRDGKILIVDSTLPQHLCQLAGISHNETYTILLECDSGVAGQRVYNTKLAKATDGVVRTGDTICNSPQEMATALVQRTYDDQLRLIKHFNYDIINDLKADVVINTTELTKMNVMQIAFSAWIRANNTIASRFQILTEAGHSKTGKDAATHPAAKVLNAFVLDTGMIYRFAAWLRGNDPLDQKFFRKLEKALANDVQFVFDKEADRYILVYKGDTKLYKILQSQEVGNTVPATSSNEYVRDIIGLAEKQFVYNAFKTHTKAIIIGRNPDYVFRGNIDIWFENSDIPELARRALKQKGITEPTSEQLSAEEQDITKRNLADTNRTEAQGAYGKKASMHIFDAAGMTYVQQGIEFYRFLNKLFEAA